MGEHKRAVEHLTTPDLNLNFKRNPDGTFSATIPTSGSGNESQYPLLQALMKDKQSLQGTIENALLAEGIPCRVSPMKINLSGETNGKLTGGLEIGGGGKIKGVVDATGKVNGGVEAGGKLGGGIEFQIDFGTGGLSHERQQKLQDVLDKKVNDFCLQWAKDHPKGTSITLPNGDVLKVPEKVIQQYLEQHDPQKKAEQLLDSVRDGIKKAFGPLSDTGSTAPVGFASPEHPYHRMYTDTLGRIGEMTPRPGGDQKPETIAAALVQSAAEARFDPNRAITLASGRDSNVLIAIQGTPGDPASRQTHIDAAQAKAPSAEQVAQLQSPVRDETTAQTRQPSQGLG